LFISFVPRSFVVLIRCSLASLLFFFSSFLLLLLLLRASGTVVLKTQYRCHPVLGSLAASLFYPTLGLKNGTCVEERSSVLPRIVLPLAWADVRGAEHHHAGGSYSNRDEALAVASLVVHSLLYVDAARVGVICLYRAQASAVQRLLENVAAVVRRPVPQAVGALCASLAATAAAAGADAAPTQDIATLARRAAAVKVSTVDAFQGEARPVFLLLLLLFAHPCSHPNKFFCLLLFCSRRAPRRRAGRGYPELRAERAWERRCRRTGRSLRLRRVAGAALRRSYSRAASLADLWQPQCSCALGSALARRRCCVRSSAARRRSGALASKCQREEVW
jgi:hypothetical protein